MRNSSFGKYVVLAVFGFIMLIAGLVLVKLLPDAQGIMRTLPFIFVGVGAGIFGGNLGGAVSSHLLKKNPNLAKQREIDTKDERNIAISNKAKAKAYDLMLYTYSAILVVFALIGVELYVVLTLGAVYLFVVAVNVYCLIKYHKEM